jgi:uncharacterized membrane protein
MGAYHPQVVHFAIALVFAGVGFRLLSLTRRLPFTHPAATTLVLAGTIAAFAATYTGGAAHGPVERIPGVRDAVEEHEEWGERARNLFAIVSAIEAVTLALYWGNHRSVTTAAIASAVVGVVGLGAMYEAAEHGGALVYNYAGGVGIRRGEAADVNQLFVTGLYQQALQDRQSGRGGDAMALIELAATRVPANLDLQLLGVEWTTDVKRDPAGAVRWLDRLQIPQYNARARIRAGLARANALAAEGNAEGARGVLQTLRAEFPNNAQIKRRIDELAGPAAKD